jgi:hypothetical protein
VTFCCVFIPYLHMLLLLLLLLLLLQQRVVDVEAESRIRELDARVKVSPISYSLFIVMQFLPTVCASPTLNPSPSDPHPLPL